MEEENWGWNTKEHLPEKEGLEPARGSENEPFKKQTVVTHKIRGKKFKKEEGVSCVEGSREARPQTPPVDLAITKYWIWLEWFQVGGVKRSYVLNVEWRNMPGVSPLSLQIHALPFTTLLPVPNIRQHQNIPMTPLSLASAEPWRLERRWRV